MAETNRSTHSTDCLCVYIANRISCCRADRTHTHTHKYTCSRKLRGRRPFCRVFSQDFSSFPSSYLARTVWKLFQLLPEAVTTIPYEYVPYPPHMQSNAPDFEKKVLPPKKGGNPREQRVFSRSVYLSAGCTHRGKSHRGKWHKIDFICPV